MDAEPTSALEQLLCVQDLDTLVSQLQHRRASLPERAALASLEAEISAGAQRARELEAAREELSERQSALDEEITATGRRLASIEERMYAARGTPARDLQAMDDEVHQLRRRRAEMEDAELELMVGLEPLDAELGELAVADAGLRARAEELQRSIAGEEETIGAQLSTELAARAAAAATLPDDLRKRYEELRSRLGGIGAARMSARRCGGCHLELSSMEAERVRRLPSGTVATCEQCGRILVPV